MGDWYAVSIHYGWPLHGWQYYALYLIIFDVVEYQTQAKELTNARVTAALLKDDQKKLKEELARLKGLCACMRACVCASSVQYSRNINTIKRLELSVVV